MKYKHTISIELELTDDEVSLLKRAKEKGYLEYRDDGSYSFEKYAEHYKRNWILCQKNQDSMQEMKTALF